MDNIADLLLKAFPQLGGAVNFADVLLKATPNFGIVASAMGFITCFFLIFMMENDNG